MKLLHSTVIVLVCLGSVSPQRVYPAGQQAPLNQFNIGDSIGVGEAANNSIGAENRGSVWSTGYDGGDIVQSLNERFEQSCPADYAANDSATEAAMTYNHAVSGADMADFVTQANAVISAAGTTTEGETGMVSVLLGANDMCNASLATLQSTEFSGLFESRFRAGLDALKASAVTSNASIHVSGIPALYWLWNARRQTGSCPLIWFFGSVCQVLLASPSDDCASDASRLDPNTNYPGDGTNCLRRKQFHAVIRDTYNPILESVVEEYANSGDLPNAYFLDVFDIKFDTVHVNSGDCFHPSVEGQALLAESEWSGSPWPEIPRQLIIPVVVPFLLD